MTKTKIDSKEFGQTILSQMGIDTLNGLQVLPYKGTTIKWWLMPKNQFDMGKPEDIKRFNEIFQWIKDNISSVYVLKIPSNA